MLEGILLKRDTDKQLCHSLGLKSLELGLKIRMLETDAGGKTVEVRGADKRTETTVEQRFKDTTYEVHEWL